MPGEDLTPPANGVEFDWYSSWQCGSCRNRSNRAQSRVSLCETYTPHFGSSSQQKETSWQQPREPSPPSTLHLFQITATTWLPAACGQKRRQMPQSFAAAAILKPAISLVIRRKLPQIFREALVWQEHVRDEGLCRIFRVDSDRTRVAGDFGGSYKRPVTAGARQRRNSRSPCFGTCRTYSKWL